MDGEFFRFSDHITGKCICETFSLPLHDMIISHHVKHPSPHKLAQTSLFLHAKIF